MEFYGYLLENWAWGVPLILVTLLVIGFFGSPLFVWLIVGAAALFGLGAPNWLLGAFVGVMALFLIVPIRRALITAQVMKIMKSFLPKISDTERTALEAGVVWVEADLFSGKPDFAKLMKESYPVLTSEEKAFIDGPVQRLCEMIDTWHTWKSKELEEQIWQFIKKEKFMGMIIPKEYGGLAFSALAHSEVVMKVASRSIPACITVMVPNSLGPAELLVHYGTDEQKKYYLPKLAVGEEVPCFGLTEPGAGSDAGSITSSGVVFKKDGKIFIRVNWNKRWITLAAVSTVVGLAFRLKDPENILGKGEDVGITCALIPAKTRGVIVGDRHDPLGVPFYNCPTQGKDVEIPIDYVVGGLSGVGIGWLMLMDCLSAGRGISLPAQAVGGSKLCSRVASAHSVVRQQFGMSIGQFEGVEEPLARIFGYTYGLEAMRRYTVGALDKGIKPPVITAMAKYWGTELGRKVINDAMDVLGGAGISMGPRNLLAEIYIATPIGITVEGANILTRTLIIFGQGALRAHPYAFKVVNAVEKNDLKAFDQAFFGHIGHIIRNMCRSVLLSVSRGYLSGSPVSGPTARYFRRLSWASASFAIMADIAMGSLGGGLKARQKITGRFADILAWMYIGTATLRRYEAEGSRKEDLVYVHFLLKTALAEIQNSFDGIFDNLFDAKSPSFVDRLLSHVFKGFLGGWSRINSMGSQAADGLASNLVHQGLYDAKKRDELTEGIYLTSDRNQQIGRLDYAYNVVLKAQAAEGKMRKAVKAKLIPKAKGAELVASALKANVITEAEAALMKEAVDVRWDAIQVDSFSQAEYHKHGK